MNAKKEEKIKKYITDHFVEWYGNEKANRTFEGDLEKLNNIDLNKFSDICDSIIHVLYIEKVKYDYMYRQMGCVISLYEYFKDWCQGLCEPINTSYYEYSPIELAIDWCGLEDEQFYKMCRLDFDYHRESITSDIYDCIIKHSKRSVI